MLFGILTVFAIQLLSAQGAYDLIVEDVIVADYSEEYLTDLDVYIDDSHKVVINFTIIKKLPESLQGSFSLMGASMGEYVIDTGIEVTMDFCDLLEEPILMGPLFQELGFHPDNCPPDVGVYGTEGYESKTEGMPDDFPPNMYRTVIELFDEDLKILVLHIFTKIV